MGDPNKAIEFLNNDQVSVLFLEHPNLTDLHDFSLTFWMKPTVFGTRYILEGANLSEVNVLAIGNNVIWFRDKKDGLNPRLDSNLDTWTHVAFTHNIATGEIFLYKDGA